MTTEERVVGGATAGLVIAVIGAFLPWSRIGGRSRSGFGTADPFIGLAEGVLPDAIAWIGRWWYVPAFLALAAWATTFASGRTWTRLAGVVMIVLSLVMWWLFVFAGHHWNVVAIRLTGPIVASAGLFIIGWACLQARASLVRAPEGTRSG